MREIFKVLLGILLILGWFFYLPFAGEFYNRKVDNCVNISKARVHSEILSGTNLLNEVCTCSCNINLWGKLLLKDPRRNSEKIFIDLKNKKATAKLPPNVTECIKLSLGKYGYSLEEYRELVKTY